MAGSPLQNLPKTPSEPPVAAENLGDTDMVPARAKQAEAEAEKRTKSTPTTALPQATSTSSYALFPSTMPASDCSAENLGDTDMAPASAKQAEAEEEKRAKTTTTTAMTILPHSTSTSSSAPFPIPMKPTSYCSRSAPTSDCCPSTGEEEQEAQQSAVIKVPSCTTPSTSAPTSDCCPSAGEEEKEEHHSNLPPPTKKKKKRVNKSLSRHGRGRKAKAVKTDATMNVFPSQKEEATSLQVLPTHGSIKPIPIAQKIKSIRNKKDYERRKTRQVQQAVKHLEDELLSARTNIADLSHTNKCVSLEVAQLKASSEKSSCS